METPLGPKYVLSSFLEPLLPQPNYDSCIVPEHAGPVLPALFAAGRTTWAGQVFWCLISWEQRNGKEHGNY